MFSLSPSAAAGHLTDCRYTRKKKGKGNTAHIVEVAAPERQIVIKRENEGAVCVQYTRICTVISKGEKGEMS